MLVDVLTSVCGSQLVPNLGDLNKWRVSHRPWKNCDCSFMHCSCTFLCSHKEKYQKKVWHESQLQDRFVAQYPATHAIDLAVLALRTCSLKNYRFCRVHDRARLSIGFKPLCPLPMAFYHTLVVTQTLVRHMTSGKYNRTVY